MTVMHFNDSGLCFVEAREIDLLGQHNNVYQKQFGMATRALTRASLLPSAFEDFFKPWSQLFDDRGLVASVHTVPPVNIADEDNHFLVSIAAPGLQKDDFKIELEGNVITICSEKEGKKEEKEERFTRKEYSYSSFSRSFSLPEDVKRESIEARYEDGVLKIMLPRKEEAKKAALSKTITVK
jgi:HSP20 family protein